MRLFRTARTMNSLRAWPTMSWNGDYEDVAMIPSSLAFRQNSPASKHFLLGFAAGQLVQHGATLFW